MSKDKKQNTQDSLRENNHSNSDMPRRAYSGSHAVNRRLRFDRIAVVVIPLILIIMLISALCLYSCDTLPGQDENSITATPVTQLESENSSATENNSSSEESSAESTVPSENSISGGEEISISADEVERGNLIVINSEHAYTFPNDDIDLQYVYEQRNSSYSVSDMEVQLDAETMTQLNAMMADFETQTGYSNLHVFSGYRTQEDQQSRYENGTSTFPGGCSDYHSGRTFNIRIDFGDGTTDYYNAERYPDYSWIAEHAAEYGFVVRYPAGKESITGEDARSYTFRYVGIPHAIYMTQHQLCLEEYVAMLQDYTAENPLEIIVEDTTYYVFYVPAQATGMTEIVVPNEDYTISGDNIGGFIVTYTE